MFHHAILLAVVGIATSPHSVKSFAPSGAVASTSLSSRISSFTSASHAKNLHHRSKLFASRVTFANVESTSEKHAVASFDPLDCTNTWDESSPIHHHIIDCTTTTSSPQSLNQVAAASTLAISTLLINPTKSLAAVTKISEGDYNPESFKPICGASDTFYRFLQGSTRAVVGDDNFSEYGPLIAGGLLRIRLELCVVESFFNEAVGPFIRENGLSWILPLHETVETFLAGTIFALATTFILVGSTKLIQIIAFYGDLVVGGPSRLIGGFFFDRARGEPVTLDVSFFGFWKTRLVGPAVDFKEEELKKAAAAAAGGGGGGTKQLLESLENVKPAGIPVLAVSGGIKVVGEASKIFREFIEALDLFVGRYLVLLASGYIIVKFVHFKIFPDFP